MIQDIEPRKFDIAYRNVEAENKDYALLFNDEMAMMKQPEGQDKDAEFLTFEELKNMGMVSEIQESATYLFSIDDNKYFLVNQQTMKQNVSKDALTCKAELMDWQGKETSDGKVLVWHSETVFRTLGQKWLGFVGITAAQINRWLLNHKYCGRCGKPFQQSKTERSLVCETCNITEYPRISPAIIVGIVDGGKLLLTRYADRPYKRYALIAGFGEVGESLEGTVKREVMEEVGLKVKDITYYKSQPWSFSDSLLVGFFARLDGDNTVTLEDGELAEGTWFSREKIPVNSEEIALTSEMIRYFAAGNDVFNGK
ncbi:NAD(+) diphosphatase [Aminipila sp.]|uniref:NAD(+) diphosphatase n=1 Tax=Aminipila sp. TaxID=2060095 RepID=UPI00289766C9|nr:NAD(+) diphosphatase [Aminipila sp.]